MAIVTEKIQYDVNLDADVDDVSKILRALNQIEDSLEDMAKETKEVTQRTEEAENAQRDMARGVRGLTSSWKDMISLDVTGYLDSIANVAVSAFNASRNWATDVERISRITASSLEDAAALQTSWTLAGLETEEALNAISGFQGRLIDDLEAQAEAQKELIELEEDRLDLLEDAQKAADEHAESIADLEQQITQVGNKEIAEREASRDKSLESLQKDYNKFLDEQEKAEQQETQRLSDIWQERVAQYERDVIQAVEDLETKSSRARNFREFNEIQDQFSKRVNELEDSLGDEKSKHQSAVDEQAESRQAAIDDEKAAIQERSTFIQQKADEDLEKIKARNVEQVASLTERIEEENEAWAEQQESFSEGLEDIDKAQAEAMKSGGSLKFIVDELGVSMFKADGTMRPVSDLIFELKDRLDKLPESARKAAIIADLGWEDLAGWIEDGANATDSLKKAQDLNLVPTEKSLEAIRKQNEQLALLQLQLIGVTGEYTNATAVNEILTFGLESTSKAITIAGELWNQIKEIIRLVVEQVNEGADAFANLINITSSGGIGGLVEGIGNVGFGEGADVSTLFQGISGGLLSPSQESASARGLISDTLTSPTININGVINGVEDFKAAIRDALAQYNNQFVSGGR